MPAVFEYVSFWLAYYLLEDLGRCQAHVFGSNSIRFVGCGGNKGASSEVISLSE